jgi:hypothetical protein
MTTTTEPLVGEVLDPTATTPPPPPPHPFPRPHGLRDRLDRLFTGPPGRHRRR